MTYVKIDPKGTRLGNWMFQFAAAKTAAPTEPVTFVIEDERDWPAVQKYACLWGDVQYASAAPQGAEVRVGLFQDEKFIDRELAKKLFRFSTVQPSTSPVRRSLGEGGNLQPLVSIHVRRGDYLKLPHRHPFVGEKYLRAAVERFPGAEFMVFSDDIPWCKRFFGGPKFHFSEGGSVMDDLYRMTQCGGGHICSNSTFSWWGAFLGEGKTVFPSMWYGIAMKGADWRGMYFRGSEVVDNRYSLKLYLKAVGCIAKTRCGDVLRWLGLR